MRKSITTLPQLGSLEKTTQTPKRSCPPRHASSVLLEILQEHNMTGTDPSRPDDINDVPFTEKA